MSSTESVKNFVISSVIVIGLYMLIQEKDKSLDVPVVPSMDEMEQAIHSNDIRDDSNDSNDSNLINDIEREMIYSNDNGRYSNDNGRYSNGNDNINARYGDRNGVNFNKRKEVMYNTHADTDKYFSDVIGEVSKGSIGQLMGFNESSDSFAPIDNSFQNPAYSTNLIGRTDIANNFNQQTNTLYSKVPQMNLDQMKSGNGFNIDNNRYYQ